MAVGDLSADQRRYRAALVAATGLDRDVVTSWIGAESGWNRTKSDHNYLNIGPGRRYDSTTEAARAAADLVNESGHYGAIREAIKSGDPVAQVNAIWMSPWDAGRYGGDGSRLTDVYEQLTGNRTGTRTRNAAEGAVEGARDAAGEVVETVTNPVGKVGELIGSSTIRDLVVRTGLTLFLLGASAALIIIGVLRLTRIDNAAYQVVTDLLPG